MEITQQIFIDEAGNSGANLIDKGQPLFTIAALGIEKSQDSPIKRNIDSILIKYRLKDRKELKTNQIMGTKYEPALFEIFNVLLENKCHIFYTVVEKKYMICGRIIENFFDPFYNTKTDNSWTFPSDTKTKLANFFYNNLSEKAISISAKAHQKGAIEDLKSSYNILFEELKNIKYDFDILKLLKGVESKLELLSEHIIDSECHFKSDFETFSGTLTSPNTTTYFDLIMRIEHLLRNGNSGYSEIIFDSSRQFNEAFKKIFNIVANAPSKEFILPNNKPIISGFEKIKQYSYLDSNDNFNLQLCDIIASSINKFFSKIITFTTETKFTHYETFLAAFNYSALDVRVGDLIMSDKLKHKLGRAIVAITKDM